MFSQYQRHLLSHGSSNLFFFACLVLTKDLGGAWIAKDEPGSSIISEAKYVCKHFSLANLEIYHLSIKNRH
jgi:hypothetical protein